MDIIQDLQSKCEQILKTLPLSHYLKVDTIPVAFDTNSDTSYFDPRQFRIVIAFNNIAMVINSKKALPNELELEKTIRCFLYHELSHAMLTPKDLMRYAYSSQTLTPQLANIICDERIETVLKHYYLNVDFKENLRNASPLDKQIKSFEHFVFNCVRHRCSPIMATQVNRLVNEFISKTKHITANSYYGDLLSEMERLVSKLKTIFNKLPKAQSPNPNQQSTSGNPQNGNQEQDNSQSENGNSNEQDTEDNGKKGSGTSKEDQAEDQNNSSEEENGSTEGNEENDQDNSQSSSSDLEEDSESSETDSDNSEDSSNGSSLSSSGNDNEMSQSEMEKLYNKAKSQSDELENGFTNEELEEIMKKQMFLNKQLANQEGGRKLKITDFEYEKDTKIELLKIIGRNAGFGVNQTQVQFGYNGKFNAKKFATDFNDSCKWFQKRAYEDTGLNNKKNNTKVLNIWLDNSGSYSHNDYGTNLILSALASIETQRNDFKFNLITFGDDFHEKTGEDRISCSNEGTTINQRALELYKKYNPTQSELNIFLIDGGISEYTQNDIDNAIKRLKNELKNTLSSARYTQEDKDYYSQRINEMIAELSNRNTSCYENLKLFDNKRTIFISEQSNEDGIKRVCPSATLIIENSKYTEELTKNIIKAFDLLF